MPVSSRIITAAAVAGIFCLSASSPHAAASTAPLQGLNAPLAVPGDSVSCSLALREVLPTGWRLTGATVPADCSLISWNAGDTALSVYKRIASQTGLSVVADVADETLTLGAPAGAASGVSREGFSTVDGPKAFVGTSVRVPLQAIATRYDLALRCEDACERALPGPITLELSGDIGEDAKLLEDGLGPIEPLRIVEDPVDRTLSAGLAPRSSFIVTRPRPKPWWKRIL